jgi:2-hydroxychromene-2-carboxylate isomerase
MTAPTARVPGKRGGTRGARPFRDGASHRGADHLEEIEENQKALAESGHWGVPTTFVFKGEPFFG